MDIVNVVIAAMSLGTAAINLTTALRRAHPRRRRPGDQ